MLDVIPTHCNAGATPVASFPLLGCWAVVFSHMTIWGLLSFLSISCTHWDEILFKSILQNTTAGHYTGLHKAKIINS